MQRERRVGVLHPGRMGVTVASALVAGGASVRWASEGRSEQTRERARIPGLGDAGSLAALVRWADVLVAVCPPHAALDLAGAVAEQGFTGTYVDANAISPATARAIETRLAAAGAVLVDGGIIGPPALSAGSTRLYLSGPHAPGIAELFAGTALDARPIDGGAGAASALKMAFASWTKGTSALLVSIRALARAEGVEAALLDEWSLSWPELEERSRRAGADAAGKAWRFVAEMRETARTMRARDLPAGFGDAAAELYERLAPLAGTDPDLEDALAILARSPDEPDGESR